MTPSIRPARGTDAAEVARLVSALGYPTEAAAMRERLAAADRDPAYATLVAERAGRVVGVVGVRVGPLYERDGPGGHVMLIAVSEEAQGRGVGRALVESAEAWARERGAVEMVVHSGDQRTGAHAFYRRAGFRDTGRRFIKLLVP